MGVHLKLICNAASGGGTDAETLSEALKRHGATLGDEAPERLVVAGGDGTVGHAAAEASGLGVPLAVVPTGTANDFARAMGLPEDLDEAIALAATGTRTRTIELGEIDGRPFVNAASAGLAPSAARRAAPLKRLMGPLAYPVGGLAAGLLDRPIHCTVGDAFDGDAWQVTVACTGAFGGGAEIEPADPQDGLLDLVVVPAGNRLGLLRRAAGMRRGTLAEQPGVVHLRADALVVEVPPGTPFNVDGEVVEAEGQTPFRVERAAFSLVAP